MTLGTDENSYMELQPLPVFQKAGCHWINVNLVAYAYQDAKTGDVVVHFTDGFHVIVPRQFADVLEALQR